MMLKLKVFVLMLSLAINSLFSIQIVQITDISNERMLFDYDKYSGAITGFGDRLVMVNLFSIEEFEILEYGNLNRISYFETSSNSYPHLQMHNDKLFFFSYRENINDWHPHYYCRVFDIAQQPMIEIVEFELPEIISGFLPSFNFHNSHIYISFQNEHGYHMTAKYSIETFSFVSYVQPALGGSWVLMNAENLYNMFITNEGYYQLRIFDFFDDQIFYLNNIILPIHSSEPVRSLPHISGSYFIFPHSTGSVVVDISDVMNPVIVADIRINGINNIVEATYTGEFVIMSSQNKEIRVYQQNQNGDFTLFWQNNEEPFVGGGGKDIYVKDSYIFHQRGNDLIVFDLFTSVELFRYYKKLNFTPFYYISPQEYDFYFNWLNWDSFSFDIYSVFRNELIVSVQNEYQIPQFTYHFQIENDKLYITLQRERNYFFEIYDIEDNQGSRINSLQLFHPSTYFILKNDKLFIETSNSLEIYHIENNQLIYIATLPERLENRHTRHSFDFIITFMGRSISFRDVTNHNNILFSALLPHAIGSISYIGSNYLLVYPPPSIGSERTAYIYEYNLEEGDIKLFHAFPTQLGYTVSHFNGVITDSAYLKATSDYFSILNNELVTIGQKEDRNREIWNTFIYPEKNKMVQVAMSGIWVYDIEFEEYVSDDDIVILPASNSLLGNYPNPFNPETTISFILQEDAHVKIDIYNIKGQKVKTLVNDFKTYGNHEVIWNGVDDNGRNVGSGIYLYKMTTNEYSDIKRMVLLK